MRGLIIAMTMAVGFGLVGTSATLAAPASAAVIRDLATAVSLMQDVRGACARPGCTYVCDPDGSRCGCECPPWQPPVKKSAAGTSSPKAKPLAATRGTRKP